MSQQNVLGPGEQGGDRERIGEGVKRQFLIGGAGQGHEQGQGQAGQGRGSGRAG